MLNFSKVDAQWGITTSFSRQLRTEEWTQRLQTRKTTVYIDEGIMFNIKNLDFFHLNIYKNSYLAKARACRNSGFWDEAGIDCSCLHIDDPEALLS